MSPFSYHNCRPPTLGGWNLMIVNNSNLRHDSATKTPVLLASILLPLPLYGECNRVECRVRSARRRANEFLDLRRVR